MRARLGIVWAVLSKDLRLFARDRFYVVVSVIGLVFYVAVFWLLPAAVDETIGLGVHLPGGEELLADVADDPSEGFEMRVFGSSEELAAAVEAGDQVIGGLDFPPDFLTATAAGQATTVRVLLAGDAPEELRPALTAGVREIAFALVGNDPPVTLPDMDEIVLGADLVGRHPSLRDQMAPLFVFLVLVVEMFALGTLVASEIATRTVTAVLATPARVIDLLAAKAVLGTTLAFSQAVVIALALGVLGRAPLLLLVTLLLGALLVTGFGLMAGATGADFVGIVFWSMLAVVPLALPAFAVLFPGPPAGWIQVLPTHGLVEIIVGTTAFGEGWAEAADRLVVLALWCVAVLAAGAAMLGRRVARV